MIKHLNQNNISKKDKICGKQLKKQIFIQLLS